MHIPQGFVKLDARQVRLAGSVETPASLVRDAGNETVAVALFRLRTKIREGLSYEEAKPIFDQHTSLL